MSKLTQLPVSAIGSRPLIKSDSSSLQRSSCPSTRRSQTEEEKPTVTSLTDLEERGMGVQEKEKEKEKEEVAPPAEKKQKTSKEVYFSVLPDRYEPLIEELEEEEEEEWRDEALEERRRRKEEKKRRKKKKYKKYRKNFGKAVRFSWRCLMAGLQSMVSTYSTPLSAMATVVTEVNRSASSKA